ncbi:MAG: hypothetical protein HUU10_04080 [Bacteroidetes bacterium]|nr:hypothetical protein [Bacteroidota bacterium]
MNKIPRASVITRRLPGILVLTFLFSAGARSQSFESAFDSEPVYNWIGAGMALSTVASDRDLVGLSTEASPILGVLEGQFHGTRFGFFRGSHDSDSGRSSFLSGLAGLRLTEFQLLKTRGLLVVPMEVSSRFTQWKRPGDNPETRLNGSSIELVTGLGMTRSFDFAQLSANWLVSAGLAFQELTDYNGTLSATSFRIVLAFPDLYGEFGLAIGGFGSYEKWKFERDPGDFNLWYTGLTAGVCW